MFRAAFLVLSFVLFAHHGIAESLDFIARGSVTLLLALPDGERGVTVLTEWADYLGAAAGVELPPVWVVVSDSAEIQALVRDLPRFLPFAVEEGSSWAQVLKSFRDMNQETQVFGLLGEGVLPPPDFSRSIQYVARALAGTGSTPTAVLTRSTARGDSAGDHEWLQDTFIAQLWMNRASLEDLALEGETFRDVALLDVLPRLICAHRDSVGRDIGLVDGTGVLTSIFDVSSRSNLIVSARNKASPRGGDVHIGALGHAIVLNPDESDGGIRTRNATIAEAPWPPPYVLEATANDNGLVVVNSVNCRHLNLATNLWRSVQRVSDIKVLWVTTDEVAFDFLDDLAPGCVASFPIKHSERPRAIKAESFGDATFSPQALIRPHALLHILNQGYTLLWTDSDMVWLDDVSSFLPDSSDPESAELALAWDGRVGKACTGLLFMKPTDAVKEMVELWAREIVETNAREGQAAFQRPFKHAIDGIRVKIFSGLKFPSGLIENDDTFQSNYARVHDGDMAIFHSSYAKGPERKIQRFKKYGLWDVAGVPFPTC